MDGQDLPLAPEVIKVAAVDDYLNRQYRSRQGSIGLYVGYYQSQRQGEALHSPLFCLPGIGWQPVTTSASTSPQLTVPPVVNALGRRAWTRPAAVLYWYQTLTRVTASEYWRKLFLMHDAFSAGTHRRRAGPNHRADRLARNRQ